MASHPQLGMRDLCLVLSYRKFVEEMVKGNHGNLRKVLKAHLVCERQLRYGRLTWCSFSLINMQLCS